MPLTNFSPYLKDGVLDLNQEGNIFSIREGQSKNKEEQSKSEEVKLNRFEDIFDIKQLVKFIQTTPDITEFKATLWGIGKMGINDFRSLMDAIGNSDITALNFENNTLSPEMAEEISKLSKLTELNLGGCDIDDEKIAKIAEKLCNIATLNVENNSITDIGVGAIAKHLPNLLSLNASCNGISDTGADKIKCFKKIKEITIPYGNNISFNVFKGVVEAHSNTLTKVDLFSSAYTSEQLLEIAGPLTNCVIKLGPYWTKGVNHINEAPLRLVEAVWEILPPVDHVGVVGDVLEG
ncbi:hypothetical protein [Candidatus Tisiphia endosymbiont of Piscicola geometra]|uniref:hypothetical protein n=1 Tax=Candidatus Tisiphia endosymbiont of Piscicola geometra TaxID=3066273 RepID=UPI00312CB816